MQSASLDEILLSRQLKIFLIFTLIAIFLLSLPLFFARGIGVCDDSNFLMIAKWIDYGVQPYNDLIEIKPPGIFYTLNVLNKLFGEAWWVSRIFLLFVIFALVAFTMLIMLHKGGYIAALLTGILFYPTLMLFQGYALHTEQFCALFGAIALIFIYRVEKSLINIFIAGVFIGIASLFKQSGIFYLTAYLFSLLIFIPRKKLFLKKGLVLSLLISAGFLSIWAVILPLLYRQKMLEGFFRYAILYPLYSEIEPGNIITRFLFLMPRFLATPMPIMIIFGIVAAIKYKERNFKKAFDEDNLIVILIFLFSLIPLFKRPTPHYIICALFSFIILGVKLWLWVIKRIIINSKSNLRSYFIFLLILPALPSIAGMTFASYFFIREGRLKIECLQAQEIGNKIIQFSDKSEPILQVSFRSCARIYYMLERRPPLNYIHIIGSINNREKPEKLKEILEIINQAKSPIVILEDSIDHTTFKLIPIEEFRAVLNKNYRQLPLRFAFDYSRNTKIELYVLKNLSPIKRYHRSSIFPSSCCASN